MRDVLYHFEYYKCIYISGQPHSIAFRIFLKEDEPFRNIPRKSGMSQERYPFFFEDD